MEEGKLPLEVAQEPMEEARLSQSDESTDPVMHRKNITFSEATQSTDNGSQTSKSAYKDVLSQPSPGLTHRARLQWLQKRRSAGLWAQCDHCARWRFLPDVIDASELPARWLCAMNPDKSAAECSVPEAPLHVSEEEDLIHGSYSAGSVVWARLAGWPWWPAMVDDEPDTEQYYWLDGFSDIPTHYNVVFFDSSEATRAWISPENLMPFGKAPKVCKTKKYVKRLEVAVTQAKDAMKLSLEKRLAKYSFIARYPGSINKPKKISKHELKKFQKKFQKMYGVDYIDESFGDDNEHVVIEDTTVIKKTDNILLVGTPKSKQNKRRKTDKTTRDDDANSRPEETIATTNYSMLLQGTPKYKQNKRRKTDKTIRDDEETIASTNNSMLLLGTPKSKQDTLRRSKRSMREDPVMVSLIKDSQQEIITDTGIVKKIVVKESSKHFKQPDSLLAQVGSNVTSTVADFTFDNDSSVTYVPGSESETNTIRFTAANVQKRAVSPRSDDFDF